jgi:NitT/TauT family transport system permease protein
MRSSGNSVTLRVWQALLLVAVFAGWHVMTVPGMLPAFYFGDPNRAAFLFGEPLKVFGRIWQWFWGGDIYRHLWVTLIETLLAFAIGTILGIAIGIWLPRRYSTRTSRRSMPCRGLSWRRSSSCGSVWGLPPKSRSG